MKLVEVAHKEQKTEKGTYAAVKFDKSTVDRLIQIGKDSKIPGLVVPSKLHTTLLYSRKFLPDYTPAKQVNMIGTSPKWEIWPSQGNANCLVLVYKCPELTQRHEKLLKRHDTTYDYDYKPHITLSYDVGDLSTDDLPDIAKLLPKIVIDQEYGEDLDLDWANTSTKEK